MTPPRLVYGPAREAVGPLPATGPRAGADRGDPLTATLEWQEHAAGRAAGIGVWECTPGSWTIEDARHDEILVVQSGRVRLTDAGGRSIEATVGDTVLLPRGWHGRWEVLETVRKIYVIS